MPSILDLIASGGVDTPATAITSPLEHQRQRIAMEQERRLREQADLAARKAAQEERKARREELGQQRMGEAFALGDFDQGEQHLRSTASWLLPEFRKLRWTEEKAARDAKSEDNEFAVKRGDQLSQALSAIRTLPPEADRAGAWAGVRGSFQDMELPEELPDDSTLGVILGVTKIGATLHERALKDKQQATAQQQADTAELRAKTEAGPPKLPAEQALWIKGYFEKNGIADPTPRQVMEALDAHREAVQKLPTAPEQQYINEYRRNHPGATVENAITAYGQIQGGPGREEGRVRAANMRADRSYQFAQRELDAISKPITDSVMRLGRLQDTLAAGTPQADALVAPELLTVMAGGQGSGLRMNEAEIARIVGGRSHWENLKGAAQKWSLDPSTANTITPNQRQQIHALVSHVGQKLKLKQAALSDAADSLAASDDPLQHRKIVVGARKKLVEVDQESSQQRGGGAGGGVTVALPDGRTKRFPDQQAADAFKREVGIK